MDTIPVHVEKIKRDRRVYTVSIYPDLNPENPREGFDNLGHMACAHRRYNLGDEQLRSRSDIHSWDDVEAMLRRERKACIILPLYLYDHSVQAISTTPWQGRAQHAEWDSGQVGFIYVTRPKLLEEYGTNRATKGLTERVTKYLKAEVEVYDHYLRGEVYGYVIEGSDGDTLGSCWGYCSIQDALKAAKEGIA